MVRKFISLFDADIFFTVKYDYWYHLLEELKMKRVETYVISALFYERQAFFTSYGKWFVKQLQKNIDWFFHQNEISFALARSIGLNQSSVTGDTRFDRVKQLQYRDNRVDFIRDFIDDKKVVVFGSCREIYRNLDSQNIICRLSHQFLRQTSGKPRLLSNTYVTPHLCSV